MSFVKVLGHAPMMADESAACSARARRARRASPAVVSSDPLGARRRETQWLRGGNGCHAQHYSMGREFGRKTNAVRHREKAHVRIFETGEGQLAGDAHRERKVACDDDGKQNDDADYPRFDGKSGFDAAMDQMVRAFRRSNGWVVTIDTLRGPYVHSFRQCDHKWVTWSGDIAYITRMGP